MTPVMSSRMQRKRPNPRDPVPSTPARIMRIAFGFAPAQALASAVDVRLFSHVAAGNVTLEHLHRVTGIARRGLRLLLEAMDGLGLLTRHGIGGKATYSLTSEADAYLVEGRPGYHGDLVCLHLRRLEEHWTVLTERVRSGAPVLDEMADLLRAHELLEAAQIHMPEPGPRRDQSIDHAFPLDPTTGPTTPRR